MTRIPKQGLRWLRRGLGVALFGAFAYFLTRTFTELTGRAMAGTFWPGLAAVGLTFAALLLWLATFELAWEWALRRVAGAGRVPPWSGTALAFFRSRLARYVPGKIWEMAARTQELARLGLPPGQIAAGLLYEQAHYFSATVVFGVLAAPLWLPGSPWARPMAGFAGACAIALAATWLLRPHALLALLNRVIRRMTDRPEAQLALDSSRRDWALAFVLFATVVALQALSVAPLAASGLSHAGTLSVPIVMTLCLAYPIARLVGQISVFVPGGLGVREGAYVLLAAAVVDAPTATVIAVWARLLSLIAEVGVAALAWGWHGRACANHPDPAPTRRR